MDVEVYKLIKYTDSNARRFVCKQISDLFEWRRPCKVCCQITAVPLSMLPSWFFGMLVSLEAFIFYGQALSNVDKC